MEKITKIIGLLCFSLFTNVICDACKCNLEELIRQSVLNNSTLLGKRQLPEIEDESAESFEAGQIGERDFSAHDAPSGHLAPNNVSATALNETHFELNETEFQTNTKLKQVCPFYKEVPELSLHKLPGIWKAAYYKPSGLNITCFKMQIKSTSIESRRKFSEHYSSFNNTIDWKECHLELSKPENSDESIRHFLQGQSNNERGILENIVLSEIIENDTKTITLQEQAPDQWMTYKNLLLMRDCDVGTLFVFSRASTQANFVDVEHALKVFGEVSTSTHDMISCEDGYEKTDPPYQHVKYNILS